jgi:uncharacterized SAM-binding protein YcdF (DUF218 family)
LRRRGCLLVALLALSLMLGAMVFALNLGQILNKTDPPAPADAIVVLGGDRNYNRMRQAVELWKLGFAPLVVFSLPPEPVELPGALEQATREAATKLGLVPAAEVFAGGATSTYEEAHLLGELSNERSWHGLIVVTDSYHTRRAGQTFHALLPTATIITVAAPNPTYDIGSWWNSEDGLISVPGEVVKLGFYFFRYGIAPL